ncbi:MAG: hypothetical protein EBU88_11935 [Acidobacteria bacterium]|nr:hypothetical protein [Acidobacteriota bacterium]
MKPLVNLATDPFRNRRLFWISIFLLFSITTIFGQQAIRQRAEREGEIRTMELAVKLLEARLGKAPLNPIPGSNPPLILPEQNTEIYAASELIARKSFSWSTLLGEIERIIPPGVRVLRIAVSTVVPEEKNGSIGGPESAATLNLEIIAKTNADVVKLINLLHGSGRFRVSPVSQKPIEGTGEIEFALRVEYFPQTTARSTSAPVQSKKPNPTGLGQPPNSQGGSR